MAVRRERVELDLADNYTPKVLRATAATAMFRKEVDAVNGRRVSKDMDDTAKSVEKVGNNSRKAGSDLNQFTGRLGLLADAAITLGPALIPLAGGTIPALTGALTGLGAAAGALGVGILAFHGLDDAMKALQNYNLEPTTQNLQKLRIEQEKLGASGSQFLEYVDGLTPVLQELQETARAGIFPGVEQGINDLLGRLPEVKTVISEIASGMGDLAADAGKELASSDFDGFFRYLETDARPTLDAFARSAGNVGLGVANLLTAFAPLSRDFTGGLESATRAFANWSKGLDQNQSFQEFVDYVRREGPQVVAFASQTAQALAAVSKAAAPIGSVSLGALTQVAKVLTLIGNSPIGPAIYGAIAALTALNRISGLTASALDKLNVSSEKTRSTLSKYAGLGAGVIGVGMAVGSLADNIGRIDPDNLDRALQALSFGNVTDDINTVVDDLSSLSSKWNSIDLGEVVTLGGLFGDDTLDRQADNIDQVDKKLAQLVETGQQAEAQGLFQQISDMAQAKGVSADDVSKRFDAYNLALQNAAAAAKDFGSQTGQIPGYVGQAIDSLLQGSRAAQQFSASMAELNGWFDHRDAVRGYLDSIDTLNAALKKDFNRETAADIDAVGRGILQVANTMGNPQRRAAFLDSARDQLNDLADKAGPKASAAIQRVIDKFDSKGLTSPPPIKLTADEKAAEAAFTRTRRSAAQVAKTKVEPKVTANIAPAVQSLGTVQQRLTQVNQFAARPTVTANVSPATAAINSVRNLLTGLNGTTATTYVKSIRVAERSADGSTVPKTGLPYADRHPYMLADGEEVISNRYGQADRHRGLLKAINANMLADGGTAGTGKPLFTGEGPRFYRKAYKHNRPFAIDGPDRWDYPYQTSLTDAAMARAFEKWVADNNVPFDVGARLVDYDMRGYWKKTRGRGWKQGSHFPDTFKTPYDTTFSHESKYATADNPFYWHGDQLVDIRDGSIVFAANGGTVAKTGRGYADRHPYLLADGEEVVSNRFGQADRWRPLLKAINNSRLAAGGTVGNAPGFRSGAPGAPSGLRDFGPFDPLVGLHASVKQATASLKELEKESRHLKAAEDRREKALDAATDKQQAAQSRYDDIASGVTSSLTSDLFAQSSGSVWSGGGTMNPLAVLTSDINNADQFRTLYAQLATRGLSADALQTTEQGGLGALQTVAGYSDAQLAQFQALYNQRAQLVGSASSTVANDLAGSQLKEANKLAREAAADRQEIKHRLSLVEKAVKEAETRADHSRKEAAKHVKDGVNGAASSGHSRGKRSS